jgi:hypothetical protein
LNKGRPEDIITAFLCRSSASQPGGYLNSVLGSGQNIGRSDGESFLLRAKSIREFGIKDGLPKNVQVKHRGVNPTRTTCGRGQEPGLSTLLKTAGKLTTPKIIVIHQPRHILRPIRKVDEEGL